MNPKPLLSLNHFTVPMVRIPNSDVADCQKCGISVLADRLCCAERSPRAGDGEKTKEDLDACAVQILCPNIFSPRTNLTPPRNQVNPGRVSVVKGAPGASP